MNVFQGFPELLSRDAGLILPYQAGRGFAVLSVTPSRGTECSVRLGNVPAVRRYTGHNGSLGLVWGPGPPLLVIQAGRDRDNVLISVSPMPNIREYLHTDWGPLRSQIYE